MTNGELDQRALTGPFVEQTWEYEAPDLRWMLDYWQERRGDRERPRWRDIDLLAIYKYAPKIVVKDAIDNGADFVVRFWGTEITEWLNFDGTGKRLSDYFPKTDLENILSSHRLGLLGGIPVRRWGISRYPDRDHVAFDTITLSLDGDDDTPAHIITLTTFQPASTADIQGPIKPS